jgi:outer membrane cobalamin receptor
VQAGARGGVTSIFVRGGNSNFNKLLIDGIPANDIGGSVDLSEYSVAGVDRIEALRDPNSVVFGSDALSGGERALQARQDAYSTRRALGGRRQSRHASRDRRRGRHGSALRLLQ